MGFYPAGWELIYIPLFSKRQALLSRWFGSFSHLVGYVSFLECNLKEMVIAKIHPLQKVGLFLNYKMPNKMPKHKSIRSELGGDMRWIIVLRNAIWARRQCFNHRNLWIDGVGKVWLQQKAWTPKNTRALFELWSKFIIQFTYYPCWYVCLCSLIFICFF